MINLCMSRHSVVVVWNFCLCTRHYTKCTRYMCLMYKGVQRYLCWRICNPFKIISILKWWRTFSHTFLDHTLIPFNFITSYMFIGWPTTVMMNRNLYWVSLPPFPLGITLEHGSSPICTLLVVAMSNFCHCIRHLH